MFHEDILYCKYIKLHLWSVICIAKNFIWATLKEILAHENFYFNTLDLEKVQGKSLSCIKSRRDTSPAYCTPTLQGATAEGWKSRMRLASRELPTPGLHCASL